MKKIIPFFLGIALLFSCSKSEPIVTPDRSSRYMVDPVELDWSKGAENIYFRFNIIDKRTDEKIIWNDLKKDHFEVVANNEYLTIKELSRLLTSKGYIPENILVLLLVDRSLQERDMEYVRNAVSNIVNTLPNNTVYISFFDQQLRNTLKITRDNFDNFMDEFTPTRNEKILFDAALVKFKELCGDSGAITDGEFREKIDDEGVRKYLVMLTDGKVNVNNFRTADNIQTFSDYVLKLDGDASNRKNVEIHAIRYGEVSEDVDFSLSYLCVDLRNDNVKGGFYIAAPESFIEKLKVSDKAAPDYELTVYNPDDKFDFGVLKNAVISVQYDNKTASEQTDYTIGSLLYPVKSGSVNIVWQLIFGVLIWAGVFGLAFALIHIIIPYIRFDIAKFDRKYVRPYSFDEDTVIQCHYCLEEIMDEEEIVTKCRHIVHKSCWIENGCKCADYGESCKEGKQYFFDSKNLLNKRNRPFYTPFIWYGFVGGLITWLVYQLLVYFFPYPLESLIMLLFPKIYPGYDETPALFLRLVYMLKTNGFLIVGILLGFIPVYALSNLNRIRNGNTTFLWVLLKSILGAIGGMLAFSVGSIAIIYFKTAQTSIWLDWIPWVLSGSIMGVCLSIKENVVWKHVILGGMLAGLACFFILFLGMWLGSYAVLLGFMALGAIMGYSLVSARRTIHTYFLKFQGKQSGIIAVHKWMSVAGGSEEVSIGKSPDCTIYMDWDKHHTLRDVNVKMYMDKKYHIPCLKVMEEHLIYDRIIARKHDEFFLKHGVTFKIGDTIFQYTEKTK